MLGRKKRRPAEGAMPADGTRSFAAKELGFSLIIGRLLKLTRSLGFEEESRPRYAHSSSAIKERQ
jgi:hypothetical protein